MTFVAVQKQPGTSLLYLCSAPAWTQPGTAATCPGCRSRSCAACHLCCVSSLSHNCVPTTAFTTTTTDFPSSCPEQSPAIGLALNLGSRRHALNMRCCRAHVHQNLAKQHRMKVHKCLGQNSLHTSAVKCVDRTGPCGDTSGTETGHRKLQCTCSYK